MFLVCFAVEADLRYERLYAYLQDDVTKKRPSIDLVLSLLAPSMAAKFAARSYFSESAPLFRHHLLEQIEDPSQPHQPLLAKFLKIDGRVVKYLLDSDELDARIQPYATLRDPQAHRDVLLVDDDAKRCIEKFIQNSASAGEVIIYYKVPTVPANGARQRPCVGNLAGGFDCGSRAVNSGRRCIICEGLTFCST